MVIKTLQLNLNVFLKFILISKVDENRDCHDQKIVEDISPIIVQSILPEPSPVCYKKSIEEDLNVHHVEFPLEFRSSPIAAQQPMSVKSEKPTVNEGFCCVMLMQDGVVLYTTPNITDCLGYPKDMWLGRSFIDFVHSKDR